MIDLIAIPAFEPGGHFTVAIERRFGVLLINDAHQLQILSRLTGWFPVVG